MGKKQATAKQFGKKAAAAAEKHVEKSGSGKGKNDNKNVDGAAVEDAIQSCVFPDECLFSKNCLVVENFILLIVLLWLTQ